MKTPGLQFGVVILAAGKGERLGGRAKPLIEWEGRTLLERAYVAATGAGAKAVVIVTGAFDAEIRQKLPAYTEHLLVNESWKEGMGGSVAKGAKRLLELEPKLDAILVLPSDLPLVTAELLKGFAPKLLSFETIVATGHATGQSGAPVLFGKRHFKALQAFSGAQGGRLYLQAQGSNVVSLTVPELSVDLDTHADIASLDKKRT